MTNMQVSWPGASGQQYSYFSHPIGTDFVAKPGNYIYAKIVGTAWKAVYIGQTGNLQERLANHPQEGCARRNGATHIHAHVASADERTRMIEERDLILKHDPACNTVWAPA